MLSTSSAERPVAAVLDAMPDASRRVIEDIFGTDFDLVYVDDNSAEAKASAAKGATVLLTMWGAVDAATIDAAAGARVIQKLGVGTDKIDVAAAEAAGIVTLKAAGINADAVAELAVLLTLAVGRALPKAMTAARSGTVAKEALRAESFQLLGKTVGLFGLGHIGRATARRFAPFGVDLVYHDVQRASVDIEHDCNIRYVERDEMLTVSDVISLHLPSTPITERIVNERFLGAAKRGLILINTARGSLVDEAALVAAITSGHVLGAGLDVTTEEPLPPESPLLDLDRVVVTPHVGGAVANNFPRVIARAYDNARAVLDGGDVARGDIVGWPGRTAP